MIYSNILYKRWMVLVFKFLFAEMILKILALNLSHLIPHFFYTVCILCTFSWIINVKQFLSVHSEYIAVNCKLKVLTVFYYIPIGTFLLAWKLFDICSHVFLVFLQKLYGMCVDNSVPKSPNISQYWRIFLSFRNNNFLFLLHFCLRLFIAYLAIW